MAVTASDALTAADAWATLAPLIGAGGLSGIIIAVLGYLKAAREERPAAALGPVAQTGLAVLYAEAASLETLSLALARLAGAIERMGTVIDGIDAKAVEDFTEEVRRFRHFLDRKSVV